MSTGYGYSGANAYRANSGAQIAMAVGGGLLAGVGASYAYNHLHSWLGRQSQECWAGGQHYTSCIKCRLEHSPASDCAGHFTPKVDLARDDLMTSGFVPANVTGPLRLIIQEVTGAAFSAEKLCSLTNSTENVSSNVSSHTSSALFVTLTRLSSVAAVEERDEAKSHEDFAARLIGAGVLLACCCAGLAGCWVCCNQGKSGSYSDSDSYSSGYGSDSSYEHPPPPHVQQAYQQPYPGPQYQQPYPGPQFQQPYAPQQFQQQYQPGYAGVQYQPYTPGQPVGVQPQPYYHGY